MEKLLIALFGVVILTQIAPLTTIASGDFEIIQQTTSGILTLEHRATEGGAESITSTIIYFINNILLPIVIFFGIASAIFGFYTMMTSESDDAKKKGMNYILRGVIGIMIMTSANFIGTTIFGSGDGANLFRNAGGELLSGPTIAQNIYRKVLFPFIRFVMYFIMGGLFVVALTRAITLIFSEKEDGLKEAGTIIKRNAIGIVVIIFAKSIVEAIYGKEEEVMKEGAVDLSGVAIDTSIPFVYTIINYVLGFVGLLLLIIIIIQAVQMLMKPTDEGTQKKMRRNIIYIAIGLAIMGVSYVIANFLIVR